MQIYDITQIIHNLMLTYPDHPGIAIEQVKSIIEDSENLSKINMGLHAGTHVDSPRHYLSSGKSIDQIEISNFFGACIVLDFSAKEQSITLEDIQTKAELVKENDIVLFKTKNSLSILSEFDPEYIFLEPAAAEFLLSQNIKAIGIDGPSLDKFNSSPDSHHLLFEQQKIIFKNLTLANIAEARYLFYGFPLKIDNAESSPIRAILLDY
jgi:arylformamidase